MINAQTLLKRTSFASDLNITAADIPLWNEGDLLIKDDTLLAGSAQRPGALYPVRLLVFADHASHAAADAHDPWQLMAVDRPACFIVADVEVAENAIQYTLYEVTHAQAEHIDELAFDSTAHAMVKRMYARAQSLPPASFEKDPVYMHAVGTDTPSPLDSLLTLAEKDEALHFLEEQAHPAPVLPDATPEQPVDGDAEGEDQEVPSSDETSVLPDVAVEHMMPAEQDESAAQQSDESWIVALAESILSESAAKAYMAAEEWSTQDAPDTAADAPAAAAAASALYDALHEQPEESETDSQSQTSMPGLAPETQAAEAATALYETLHLAEAHLDETPAYTDIPAHAGLKFFQANNRRLAAHPALEYAESQRNFNRLLNRRLGGALIDRLYSGDTRPASSEERDAEARRLWFDPLSSCSFFPLLSSDIESYLDGMRLQYGRFEQAADEASYAVVQSQLDLIESALYGDIDACVKLIEADRTRLHLPYRYEFSVSFDVEQRQALINLFLPQKALFPLSMQAEEEDAAFSASGFNQRYQGVACALGIITLYLVKMDAAWVHELALNAWYRTEDEPKCVYSLRVNEQALVEHTTHNTQQAFQVLKDMQARIHSGNHHELLGLDALFNLHEALDYSFGFKTYANGWTFPPVFTAITGEPTADNLEKTISMLLDLIAQGKNAQAYEAARAHEVVYRQAWLESLDESVQGLSCENELEENLALQMPSKKARVVMPRKLGQLYHILGTLASDAGDDQIARGWLRQAVRLNPVGALSLIELGKAELGCGNIESAHHLLDAARQVATSNYALAQVAKYRAICHTRHKRYELAYYLFSYAFHLYESDSHRLACLVGIHEALSLAHPDKEMGHEISLYPPTPAPATIRDTLDYLKQHNHQPGISPAIVNIVKPIVESALEGGPLPDASYVDAYLCALHAQGIDVERARSLVLNVHTVRFCDFPFSDYLFRPILLCDTDIVYTIDSNLGLAPDSEHPCAGLVAIPYIDTHAGLTLQVLGTADIHTNQPIKVLGTPVKLSATPFRHTPFRLLREHDYLAFPIAATADMLNRVYAPDQDLDATRARRDIDLLRDFSNPDNILVVLVGEDKRPEGIWATLASMDADGTLYARLANEPYDDFGVHMGDVRPIHLQPDAETGLVLAFVR